MPTLSHSIHKIGWLLVCRYTETQRKGRIYEMENRHKERKNYALFSRKGFTNDLLKLEGKEKVALFKGIVRVG